MTLPETEVGTRSPCLTLCWETTPSTLLWLFSDTSKLLYFLLAFLFFSLAEDGWTFRDELTCQNRNLAQHSSTFCCCTRSADKLCFCLNGSCESEQPITAVSCSTSRQEATWKKKRGERKRKRERELERGAPLDFIVLLSRRSKKQMLLAIKWWLTQHKGACLFACLE